MVHRLLFIPVTSLVVLFAVTGVGGVSAQTGTPADTLVGQQVTTCNEGTPFAIIVTGGLWTKTIGSTDASGSGMWLVVFYDATDIGTDAAAVAGTLKVRDERGREFQPDNPGGPLIEVLSTTYYLSGSYGGLVPGITGHSFELFLVAGDARTLTLLPDPFSCG